MPEPPCMAGVLALARMPGLVLVPLPGPPGGQQHAEPGLLQRGGLAFQEPRGPPPVFNRYPAGRLRLRLSVMGGHTEPAWARELNRNSAGLKSGWGPFT